jgi:hypothetical protein
MTRSPPDVASELLRTKSPDHLIREAEAPERKLKRTLSAFDLTCLGIGQSSARESLRLPERPQPASGSSH